MKERIKNNNFADYDLIKKKNHLSLEFHAGCLWSRQNVSKDKDIEECMLNVDKEVASYDVKKLGKIKYFECSLIYNVPLIEQIKEQKRLLNKSDYYEVEITNDQQVHMLFVIMYDQKSSTLIILNDLVDYLDSVCFLSKKIDGIKKIKFVLRGLGGGFLENEIDNEYIQKDLENKDWEDWILDIKSEMKNASPSINEADLDINLLKDFRKKINSNIKIEFEDLEEDELKILKENKII
jgi:hypothetical protein